MVMGGFYKSGGESVRLYYYVYQLHKNYSQNNNNELRGNI